MRFPCIPLILGLAFTAACSGSQATPTSPTAPATPTPSAAVLPVLTLEQDSNSPVGEAVALTYGSRSQEPGTIAIAVTGFNIRNQIAPTLSGVAGAAGRLKWDTSLLEYDGEGGGDLIGGNAAATRCRAQQIEIPGTFTFCFQRNDRVLTTGSGEIYLFRLKVRTGVTSGLSRIELVSPPVTGHTGRLQLLPFDAGVLSDVVQNVYGATITIRPGS